MRTVLLTVLPLALADGASAQAGAAATFSGGRLAFAELDEYLGRALRFTAEGRDALRQIADLRYVREAAARREVRVSEAELDAGIARLARALGRDDLRASLNEVPRDLLRAYVLLEKMVCEDLGLPAGAVPTPAQQRLWLEDQARGDRVRAPEAAERHAVVARIDGEPITVTELGRTLRTTLPAETLAPLVRDAVEERLVLARARVLGVALTSADVDAELAHRRQRLARDPRFASLTLEQVYEQQGKDPAALRTDPALLTWILWHKSVVASRPAEVWRTRLSERRAHWERQIGEERSYSWIAVTRAQGAEREKLDRVALDELRRVRARIGTQITFEEAAQVHSRDPATRSFGGLVPGWTSAHQARAKGMDEALHRAVFQGAVGEVQGPIALKRAFALVRVEGVLPSPGEEELLDRLQRFVAVDERAQMLRAADVRTFLD